jgi:hypothetical protein
MAGLWPVKSPKPHVGQSAMRHCMARSLQGAHLKTLGADKGYDTREFMADLCIGRIMPHVAQNNQMRSSAAVGSELQIRPCSPGLAGCLDPVADLAEPAVPNVVVSAADGCAVRAGADTAGCHGVCAAVLYQSGVVLPVRTAAAGADQRRCITGVASRNRSRVTERPHPARVGRGLHHATHQAHRRAEHPQAQNRRAADRPRDDRVEVCREIEVTQPSYHHWWQQYGGMQAEEARLLTQLEKENAQLQKLLVEVELEKAMLKDLSEGNF